MYLKGKSLLQFGYRYTIIPPYFLQITYAVCTYLCHQLHQLWAVQRNVNWRRRQKTEPAHIHEVFKILQSVRSRRKHTGNLCEARDFSHHFVDIQTALTKWRHVLPKLSLIFVDRGGWRSDIMLHCTFGVYDAYHQGSFTKKPHCQKKIIK